MKHHAVDRIDMEVAEANQILQLMQFALEDFEEERYLQARSAFVTLLYIGQDKLTKAVRDIAVINTDNKNKSQS